MCRKAMSRAISLLLAVVLLAGVLPAVPASAAGSSGSCGQNATWTLEDGVLTISGKGSIDSRPWYEYRDEITAVVIQSGITKIGEKSFAECKNLNRVTIPNTVTEIDGYAFEKCASLTEVTIPDSVELMSYYVLRDCTSLRTLSFGSGLIGYGAGIVDNCLNITGFYVSPDNENMSNDEHGVLFNKKKTSLMKAPTRLTGHYVVPETVKSISDGAFQDCRNLIGVTVSDRVKMIKVKTFYKCTNLRVLSFPVTLEDVMQSALAYCDNLTDIYIRGDKVKWGPSFQNDNQPYDDATRIYNAKGPSGWTEYGGCWFYYEDGIPKTGWHEDGGKRYYLGATGIMATGIVTIEGKRHEFTDSGVWVGEATTQGWTYEGGKWYYYKNGTKVTGWLNLGGDRYYLDQSGVMQTGWVMVNNKWFYLDTSGVMVTGVVTIDGVHYEFDDNGVWLGAAKKQGWKLESGKWYFYRDGAKVYGWIYEGSKRYYTDSNGVMVTGEVMINGVRHYFADNGVWLSKIGAGGWAKEDGKWYYYYENLRKATGWVKLEGKWYYLDPTTCVMRTGWLNSGGKWYYLKPSGDMAIGWVQVGGTWYFMNESGAMQTGWLKRGNTWYYLSSSGAMHTGWLKLGNSWYYMKDSGAMVTGTHVINGVTYQFNSSGVWMP